MEILLLGVGLAMDAFAVSVTKGLAMERMRYKEAGVIALFFGGFQALMPALGWLLGSHFLAYIASFDHWVAFLLLALIGGKNLKEALSDREGLPNCPKADTPECPGKIDGRCPKDCPSLPAEQVSPAFRLDIPELFLLAIATSIDALAVGITLAIMPAVSIPLAISLIGIVTFAISFVGVAIGHAFGSRFRRPAAIAGGIILIGIGCRILLEGLGIL